MVTNRTEAWETAGNEKGAGGSPAIDSAVAALLDHIAEELALEYVRLMEKAAEEGRPVNRPNEGEED